eukprot:3407294-Rhodomonas_salina.1
MGCVLTCLPGSRSNPQTPNVVCVQEPRSCAAVDPFFSKLLFIALCTPFECSLGNTKLSRSLRVVRSRCAQHRRASAWGLRCEV